MYTNGSTSFTHNSAGTQGGEKARGAGSEAICTIPMCWHRAPNINYVDIRHFPCTMTLLVVCVTCALVLESLCLQKEETELTLSCLLEPNAHLRTGNGL